VSDGAKILPFSAPVCVQVGRTAEGKVVIQSNGNQLIDANFIVLEPDAAMQIAHDLIRLVAEINSEREPA
jgi:hypothetical protein